MVLRCLEKSTDWALWDIWDRLQGWNAVMNFIEIKMFFWWGADEITKKMYIAVNVGKLSSSNLSCDSREIKTEDTTNHPPSATDNDLIGSILTKAKERVRHIG